MIYANPGEKARNLRRLWEVKVFTSLKEKTKKRPKTKVETVIAWNHVDAIRRCGGEVATLPVSLGFVTWPTDESPDVYLIEDPKVGPTKRKAKPTIATPEADDWDF